MDVILKNAIKKVNDDTKYIETTAIGSPTTDSVSHQVQFIEKVATSNPQANSMAARIETIETNTSGVTTAYVTNEFKIYTTAAAPTNCNPDDTANTYGAWVELVPASTITNDAYIYGVSFFATNPTMVNYMLQIGTGAALSEVTKISLSYHIETSTQMGAIVTFPKALLVAADVRIAIRCKCSAAAQSGNAVSTKILYWEAPLSS